VSGREDRWPSARLPAAAIGLVLMGSALTEVVGSPVALLRALGDLGHSWADPVASMLALMALMAEALVAYVLVVLVLRSLCGLPGSMGRLAGRLISLVTPVAVRRLLDVLVGGALLAQVTLATTAGTPPGHRWSGPATTSHVAGQLRWPVDAMAPAGARPTPRRSAAPPPPWLGGGPSNPGPRHGNEPGDIPAPRHEDRAGDAAASGHIVEVGDSLWDIAAARLAPGERSAANVHRYWRQIYRANRAVIGADPDLIHPGTRLAVPPFRPSRR
jgi:hypothetical protein